MNAFTPRDQLISDEVLAALKQATEALELATDCAAENIPLQPDGYCMRTIRAAAARARPALAFARRANATLQAAE